MSKERIKELMDKGTNEYGLTELVRIDTNKASEQAKIIFQADKQHIFSDFVFKSVEYLQELEIQRQLVLMLNDEITNDNEYLKGKEGYRPLSQREICTLEEKPSYLRAISS